jgi:hypothetical protein
MNEEEKIFHLMENRGMNPYSSLPYIGKKPPLVNKAMDESPVSLDVETKAVVLNLDNDDDLEEYERIFSLIYSENNYARLKKHEVIYDTNESRFKAFIVYSIYSYKDTKDVEEKWTNILRSVR